jgi:hypothetical protein
MTRRFQADKPTATIGSLPRLQQQLAALAACPRTQQQLATALARRGVAGVQNQAPASTAAGVTHGN